jgi:hypothetical protein
MTRITIDGPLFDYKFFVVSFSVVESVDSRDILSVHECAILCVSVGCLWQLR